MGNPLGIALGDALSITPQMRGQFVDLPQAAPTAPKMSRGQMIAGILADALAGAAGRPGQFAQMLQRRNEQENEMAQWGLQRRARLEDYDAQKRIDQRYDKPDVSPMERDLSVWERLTPEQRIAYQQMKASGAPDPDVAVTLPNGQFYAGPRSGLAAALSGGGMAPARPVGRLTPINGGPTPQASGGFRFP